MSRNSFCLVLFCVSALCSCKTLTSTVMFKTDAGYKYSPTDPKQREIVIKPSDQLSIIMSTNNGLMLLESTTGLEGAGNSQLMQMQQNGNQITYLVEQDSMVKIPTVGRIKLGGMTIKDAETLLEEKFALNYQKPFVKLKVTNRKVTLFFEEGTEGKIVKLPEENMTLIDAIAEAGGLSKNSKSYNIKILRGDPSNPLVINLNIRNVEDFRNSNMLLEANDIIYVESRTRYVYKVISELQPYLVLISTTVLVITYFNQISK